MIGKPEAKYVLAKHQHCTNYFCVDSRSMSSMTSAIEPPSLLVYEAELILVSIRGERSVPFAGFTTSEDPVKTDPRHYKVEFENDRARVVRIQYGPGEKSVMHSHPESVAVFLTDAHAKSLRLSNEKHEMRTSWKSGRMLYVKPRPVMRRAEQSRLRPEYGSQERATLFRVL